MHQTKTELRLAACARWLKIMDHALSPGLIDSLKNLAPVGHPLRPLPGDSQFVLAAKCWSLISEKVFKASDTAFAARCLVELAGDRRQAMHGRSAHEVWFEMGSALFLRALNNARTGGEHKWLKLTAHPDVVFMTEAYCRVAVGDPQAQPLPQTAYAMAWHDTAHMADSRTYEIAPGLGRALRRTKLGGLTCAALCVPWPACWFLFDEPGIRSFDGLSDDRFVAASVVEIEHETGRTLHFLLCDGQALVPSYLHGITMGMQLGESPLVPSPDFFTCHFAFGLIDERPLEEVLHVHEQEVAGSIGGHLDALRLVLNAILYASWPDADALPAEASPEARALFAKAEREDRPSRKRTLLDHARSKSRPRVVLGGRSTVIVDRGANRVSSEPGDGRRASPRQHWVAGHWHRARFGKGRTEVRIAWRAPHQRGHGERLATPRHSLRKTTKPI